MKEALSKLVGCEVKYVDRKLNIYSTYYEYQLNDGCTIRIEDGITESTARLILFTTISKVAFPSDTEVEITFTENMGSKFTTNYVVTVLVDCIDIIP